MGWIYAFRDERYENGVKVGWDGKDKGMERIEVAQSYSPATIIYEAAWEFPGKVRASERECIERQARQGVPFLTYPNNGIEWLDVDAKTCVDMVSNNLNLPAQKMVVNKVFKWDDFRSPRTLDSKRMSEIKQVLWVYEEHLTKRVKIQRIDDWKTPREQRRTYSRNGFVPVAAFTYRGSLSLEDNLGIHTVWEQVLNNFGAPTDNATFGWLPATVNAEDAIRFLAGCGLEMLRPPFADMPIGVRKSYN